MKNTFALVCLLVLAGCNSNEVAKGTPLLESSTSWTPQPSVQIVVTPKELIAANLRMVANEIDRGDYGENMGDSLSRLKHLNGQLGTLQASYQSLGKDMSEYLYDKYKSGEMTKIKQLGAEFRKLADRLDPTVHTLDK